MRRFSIRSLLTVVVSIAALWLAFKLSDGVSYLHLPAEPSAGWLLLAIVLQITIIMILSWRWLLLVRGLEVQSSELSFLVLGQLTWAGIGLSQIALGPVSADALRVAGLRERRVPISEGLRIVLVDRVIGLSSLLAVGLMAMLWVLPPADSMYLAALLIVVIFLGTACAIALSRVFRPVKAILANLGHLAGSQLGIALVFLSAIAHVLNIASYICIAFSIGFAPPLLETVVSVAIGLLSAVAPITVGGWGVRELAISQAFQLQDVIFDGAITVSILFGLMHIAIGIPGLLLFGWRKGVKMGFQS